MWDDMATDAQLAYLNQFSKTRHEAIDANLICEVERTLGVDAAIRYADFVSAEAASVTYAGLSEAQLQTQETAQRFYLNFLTTSPETRAKMLWHAIENIAP